MKYLPFLLIITLLFGCKKDEEDMTDPIYPLFLVVVDEDIYSGIKSNLETYVEETARGDSSAKVLVWNSGNAKQLKDSISKYYADNNILGAFLIGNLPYVSYEMDNWGDHEEFPTDLYFSSPITNWYDNDQDSIFDNYSSIAVQYFVSRIMGDASEVNSYLNKAHTYRTSYSTNIQKRAYLFIDNDWADIYASEQFSFQSIYSEVVKDVDSNLTSRELYSNALSGSGAEYVMQLIHASNTTLFFRHNSAYENMSISEMITLNPKARFYNLFNCSACRYDEENLGMSYVMKTTYGLAVMGTTKTGGNYYPQSFNQHLASGKSWGESYVHWWNESSSALEPKWTMGLVIFGDPMLKITKTAKGNSVNSLINPINSDKLDEIMSRNHF